jgi:hypothetical protein
MSKGNYNSTLIEIREAIGEEGVSALVDHDPNFQRPTEPQWEPGAHYKKRNPLDEQHGGDHYAKLGEYQPYCVLQKWMTPEELKGFAKGSAIAYLAREQDKGGREDIKKAVHHLQIYLELTQGEE